MEQQDIQEAPEGYSDISRGLFLGLKRFKGISGVVDSKAELARAVGLSRPRVSIVLNLLNLDEDIKSYMLELVDDDSRLMALNEKGLRQIAKVRGSEEQKAEFGKCLMSTKEPL